MLERIEAGRITEGRVMEMVFPEVTARIVQTGRTSITVEVALYGEDIVSGARALSTRGRIVLVALDTAGRPRQVPPLEAAAQRKEVA
ncbi:MAG TPA: hypothetical protein VHO06_13560 [Polyangia bacterium]|nr:hypothetical protein [Polyangia bacterium]